MTDTNLLAQRGREVLRSESGVIFKALHQLQVRRKAGQESAQKIWDRLIDGTCRIDLFEGNVANFFWPVESDIPQDELSLVVLLEEVALRRKELLAEAGQLEDDKFTIKVDETGLSLYSPDHDMQSKEGQDLARVEMEAKLLLFVIDMLTIAWETTNVSRWDWEEEDLTFKTEMEAFSEGLRRARDMFEEINQKSNLEDFLKALEHLPESSDEDENESEEGAGSTGYSGSSKPTSPTDEDEEPKYEWSGPESDESEEEDDEEDSNSTVKPGSSLDAGAEAGAAKSQDKVPKENLIVRHRKPKKDEKQLKTMAFRKDPCDHAGFAHPQTHFRDWKRDGFRCTCGSKFHSLKALDIHINIIFEARLLKCQHCDYKASRRCCMDKHNKEMHEKPATLRSSARLYQCQYGCEQVFSSKHGMLLHQKETKRQCKYENAGRVPAKVLPSTPGAFLESVYATFDRNEDMKLSPERLEEILQALRKDTLKNKIEPTEK